MRTPLPELEHRARIALPDVSVAHLQMKEPDRAGALDLRKGDRLVAVMWTTADGICITDVNNDDVFDDKPDYIVQSVDDALQLLVFLLGAAMATDLQGGDGPARKAA